MTQSLTFTVTMHIDGEPVSEYDINVIQENLADAITRQIKEVGMTASDYDGVVDSFDVER